MDERYIPPHRREEAGKGINLNTIQNGNNGNGGANSVRLIPNSNQMFGRTNLNLQPRIYDLETNQQGRGSRGSVYQGQISLPQGQLTLPPGNLPFPQGPNAIPRPYLPLPQAPRGGGVDLDAVRDVVQELYGPGLRQIGRPEFHKPYPDAIDRDNLYPRGYRIPEFSLFSGEDG